MADSTTIAEFNRDLIKWVSRTNNLLGIIEIFVTFLADAPIEARLVALAGFAVAFVWIKVLAREASQSPKGLERRARIRLSLLIGSYALGTAILVLFNPADLSTAFWFVVAVIGVLSTVELSVLLHGGKVGGHEWITRPQLYMATIQYVLGAVVIGVSGALVGIATVRFREGESIVAGTLVFQAAWIAAVGLSVLIARPAVISLTTSSTGIVLVGFGLASLVGGDIFFGAGVLALAVAAMVIGLSLHFEKHSTLAFAIGALATTFHVFASFWQQQFGFALVLGALAAALAVRAIVSALYPEVGGLSRFSNDDRPWPAWRHMVTGLLFLVISGVVVLWFASLLNSHIGAAFFAIAGAGAASLFVGVVLIVTGVRRALGTR
jgi:hypothetical protein